ncbi:MoaD/ThiS family protein [Rhodococcus tukisamuensis]|uniref:Molybdopterin converting factor, small subunit n=1 Tax=Rhodococcus tukisamuensis TaxID=168276 RepID=A0A1G6XJY4_9NOCA|nr:MoaD/ThiS family protein [Rhodococcus tukisamuensis]SDD78544.1 Molybdopterin converting factor, small subunit [Rhodococcus tukisamuensis]
MADGSVTVRYFAAAAEAAGCTEETLPLGAGASLGDLRTALAARHGARMERVLAVAAFLQDDELTRDPAVPVAGRVDVLPPFAGG